MWPVDTGVGASLAVQTELAGEEPGKDEARATARKPLYGKWSCPGLLEKPLRSMFGSSQGYVGRVPQAA